MKDEDSCQRKSDVSHLHCGMIPVEPEVEAGDIEDEGVDDAEGEGGDTIAIVVLWAPVVPSRIEVGHVGSVVEYVRGCLKLKVSLEARV